MRVKKFPNGMYYAHEGYTGDGGSGYTFMEAIRNCLSVVREKLFEDYVSFLAERGSSVHDIVYTDSGASFIVQGEDGDRSYPLPEKYHQFL